MYIYIDLLALHIRNLYFWVVLRICWKLKCGTSFQVHGQPSADSLESLLFPWWIFLDAKETGKAIKLFLKKLITCTYAGEREEIYMKHFYRVLSYDLHWENKEFCFIALLSYV